MKQNLPWQIPAYKQLLDFLVLQPHVWGFRYGHAGTGTALHTDEWGHTYSCLSVFSGKKRLLLFNNSDLSADDGHMFGVDPRTEDGLTKAEWRWINKMGGAKVIMVGPGDMFVFHPNIYHQVTNMENNTLSTTSYVLTLDSLSDVIVDAAHMPEEPEMGWFCSIFLALYHNLRLHDQKKVHFKRHVLKKIISTMRDMVIAARVHTENGKLQKAIGSSVNLKSVERLLYKYPVFYVSPVFDNVNL